MEEILINYSYEHVFKENGISIEEAIELMFDTWQNTISTN